MRRGQAAQAGGAQPGGDGTAAVGEQGAGPQRQQRPGQPAVQGPGQAGDQGGQLDGQGPCAHSLALLLAVGTGSTPILAGEPFRAYPASTIRQVANLLSESAGRTKEPPVPSTERWS